MVEPNQPTSTGDEGLLPLDDQGKIVEPEAKGKEGAVQPPAEGADKEGKTTPPVPPRTYTEDEWNKRQSALDTQIAEQRKQSETALTKVREEHQKLMTELEKRQDDEFVAKVEADGGDVDAAKRLVAREQAIRQKEREVEGREATFTVQMQQAFDILKRQDADKFSKQYGLDDDAMVELMKAENPVEMELTAARLAVEKSKVEQKPPVKTDSGVPSAPGVDFEKMSAREKILWGITHPD